MTTLPPEAKTRALADTSAIQDAELPEPPWLIRFPLHLANDLVASGLRLLRPFAPQFIPLAVFVFTVPVLVFFSFSAGWVVWRSIAVGWESSLDLQYG